jgi:hypothetical protein
MAFRGIALLHSGTTGQVSSISGAVSGTSAVAGDVLLAVGQQSSGTNTLSISGLTTAPALVSGPQITNSNNDVWAWASRLVTGDLSDTAVIGSSGAGYFDGVLLAFSGDQMTGLQVATTKVTTATTSLTTPALTTTAANCDIINIYALRSATSTTPVVTQPGTHTKDGAATTGPSGGPKFSTTATHRTSVGAAGAYGGLSATSSVAATGVIFTIALQPAATAGTDTGFKVYKVSSAGVDQRVSVYYVDAGGTDVQVSDKTS